MVSFLPRWDYWWKCEFDTDVKIENYYHHDGEQSGFCKKKYISKHRAKNFTLQETKNSNLFDKNGIQVNVKCHIQQEDSWRSESWLNR